MSDAIKVTSIIIVAIAIMIVCPLLFLWALNVLFALGLEYNVINWLAASVLLIFFQAGSASK